MAERSQGIHQTILIIAVTVAAVIGSVFGGISAILMTGAIKTSDVFSRFSDGKNATVLDKNIIELIEEESATISVVDQVAPSVVSVVIKLPRRMLEESGIGFDYFDYRFVEPTPLSEEEKNELVEVGGGTGFFMSADGYIVTNRHVVSDAGATYTIVTNDGAELPATVVATDAFLDIAVLDISGDGYPVATLGDSDRIRIGQTVIAIGNTLSEYRNTVTKGVVSGINRRVLAGDDFGTDEVIERAIQTDAAINPGNSGGPLINLLGEVIGINTAVSFEGQSIGFALPINDVKKIVDDIEQYGRIVRPWLGVRYIPVTEEIAQAEGLLYDFGVYLVGGDTEIEPAIVLGSPAEAAGLQAKDVILSVNGTELKEDHSLGAMVSTFEPGQVVLLKVARGEQVFSLNVMLAEFINTIE